VIIFLDEEHEHEQAAVQQDVYEQLLAALQQVMIILQNILNQMASEI